MKNVWYPLKKTHPELELKIWLNGKHFCGSGNKLPNTLAGQGSLFKILEPRNRITGYTLSILSISYPAIYCTDSKLEFCLGGRSDNPDKFQVKSLVRENSAIDKAINMLNKHFPNNPILNKQITIL
jgi:hypothetical protein